MAFFLADIIKTTKAKCADQVVIKDHLNRAIRSKMAPNVLVQTKRRELRP